MIKVTIDKVSVEIPVSDGEYLSTWVKALEAAKNAALELHKQTEGYKPPGTRNGEE